ncbi:hypothetical protein [Pontibacter akesuensis]|uniref:Uncharacterized protein n=1 Tax=Pontibacter akesuensis TaxID=388950 RepID=A0A1I7I0X7_9BACT|nr:hypothetical protein [Pontibacter akesuensis]GHA64627.1 hypothetical protein GCM10007389_16680 [Pontibacter akesuensis]SFU66613.1 hypothetical protein SAMN04487941_1829 [Pontibacter akesuensis]
MINKEIRLGKGLGKIKFGLTMEEVEQLIGEPEEVEESDEEDEFEHQAWNYWEEGYSLYFDKEDDYRLSCIETANREVQIWGERVFEMSRDQVMQLFADNDITDPEEEEAETGETRISFEREMIDLYFDEDQLIAINFGVFINDDLEVVWPEK